MAEHRVMPSKVTSAEVAAREFARVRRGYDPAEVRQFLTLLAAEVARLDAEAQQVRPRVAVTEVTPHKVDRKELTAQLGEATARILDAAQEAADDTRAKAEANVARLLREGRDEAAAVRATAAEERTALLDAAEQQAAQLRDEATAERDRASQATEAEIARAREQGRAMVAEAKEVRDRLLAEMNERRREARLQLEQLRAAGDHLRQEYLGMRERIDEQLRRLELAPAGAQAAADRVAATSLPEDWNEPLMPEAGEAALSEPSEAEGSEQGEPAAGAGDAATATDGAVEDGAVANGASAPGGPVEDRPVDDGLADDGAAENGGTRRPGREPASEEGAVVLRLAAPRTEHPRPDPPAPVAAAPATEPTTAGGVAPVPSVEDVRRRREERARTVHRRQARSGADSVPPATVSSGTDPGATPSSTVGVITEPRPPTAGPDPVDRLFARLRADRHEGDVPPEQQDGPSPTSAPATVAPGGKGRSTPAAAAAPKAERQSSQRQSSRPAGGDAEPDELAADLLGRRAEVTDRVGPLVSSALKRAVNDWLNDLLDALRTAKASASVADVVGDGPARRVDEALRNTLPAAVDAGMGQAGGRRARARNRHLEESVTRMTAEIAGSLRAKLLAEPADVSSLAERARAVVREWRQTKAAPTAVDAVRLAFGHGVLASQPDRHLVRWLCPPEGCRSADCQDNSLAPPVPVGAPFPTGDVVAPACPGCGCLVVPVAS